MKRLLLVVVFLLCTNVGFTEEIITAEMNSSEEERKGAVTFRGDRQ